MAKYVIDILDCNDEEACIDWFYKSGLKMHTSKAVRIDSQEDMKAAVDNYRISDTLRNGEFLVWDFLCEVLGAGDYRENTFAMTPEEMTECFGEGCTSISDVLSKYSYEGAFEKFAEWKEKTKDNYDLPDVGDEIVVKNLYVPGDECTIVVTSLDVCDGVGFEEDSDDPIQCDMVSGLVVLKHGFGPSVCHVELDYRNWRKTGRKIAGLKEFKFD